MPSRVPANLPQAQAVSMDDNRTNDGVPGEQMQHTDLVAPQLPLPEPVLLQSLLRSLAASYLTAFRVGRPGIHDFRRASN